MLEAKFKQADLLKKVIDALKDLVTEANISCSSNGMVMQAIDSGHVSLVSLCLTAEGFESYECQRPVLLGVKISSMAKILKCGNANDSLTLAVSDEGNNLSFIFESESGDRVTQFEMRLLDLQTEQFTIPDEKAKSVAYMPSGEFQRIVRDLLGFGDTVSVSTTKGTISFGVSGEEGKGSICIRPSEDDVEKDKKTQLRIEQPLSLNFAMRYLNNFARATPLSPTVTLCLAPDKPIEVMYSFNDNCGSLRFFLAPKIDEEDQ